MIEIGRALRSLGAEIDHVDVYSAECRPEILQNMTIENGIRFCGKINAEQVKQVMAESLALYRVGNNSLSANKLIVAKEQWSVYRKYYGFSLLRSGIYFVSHVFHALLRYWR